MTQESEILHWKRGERSEPSENTTKELQDCFLNLTGSDKNELKLTFDNHYGHLQQNLDIFHTCSKTPFSMDIKTREAILPFYDTGEAKMINGTSLIFTIQRYIGFCQFFLTIPIEAVFA